MPGTYENYKAILLLPALELSELPEFLDATGFLVTSLW